MLTKKYFDIERQCNWNTTMSIQKGECWRFETGKIILSQCPMFLYKSSVPDMHFYIRYKYSETAYPSMTNGRFWIKCILCWIYGCNSKQHTDINNSTHLNTRGAPTIFVVIYTNCRTEHMIMPSFTFLLLFLSKLCLTNIALLSSY